MSLLKGGISPEVYYLCKSVCKWEFSNINYNRKDEIVMVTLDISFGEHYVESVNMFGEITTRLNGDLLSSIDGHTLLKCVLDYRDNLPEIKAIREKEYLHSKLTREINFYEKMLRGYESNYIHDKDHIKPTIFLLICTFILSTGAFLSSGEVQEGLSMIAGIIGIPTFFSTFTIPSVFFGKRNINKTTSKLNTLKETLDKL